MSDVIEADAVEVEIEPSPDLKGSTALATQTIQQRMEIAHRSERRMGAMLEMVAKGVPVEMIKEIMAIQHTEDALEHRKAFDYALAKAKPEFKKIKKNRAVGFKSKKPGASDTSYRHEDLAAIDDAIAEPLAKYGLHYRFRTTNVIGEPIRVTCIIAHELGHFEENTLIAGADGSGNKNSIQAVASTQTYLMRYALKSALGLVVEGDEAEDDGVAGGKAPAKVLSDQQAETIQLLVTQTGSQINEFLELFKAPSIPDMLEADYFRALGMLQEKKTRQEKKAASQEVKK